MERRCRRWAFDTRLRAPTQGNVPRQVRRRHPHRRCAATASRVAASSERISTAMMPCPGAGTQSSIDSAFGDSRSESQPPQARCCEHEQVVFAGVEFPQPRVEIAADVFERRMRKQRSQLGDAANAARCRCARPIARWLRWPIADRRWPNQRIRRIFASSTAPTSRPSGSTAGMSLLL